MIEIIPFLEGLFAATIRMATPILIAAIGENLSESSGVLNLGVEGTMLVGACLGFLVTYDYKEPWLGVTAAIAAGGLIGLLMAFLSVKARINQTVSGMAITIFGGALSTFMFYSKFKESIAQFPNVEGLKPVQIPALSDIPFIGPVLFQHQILVYVGLILTAIFAIALFKTTLGLKIRAIGENPRAADTLGVNIFRVRYLCVIVGGMMAGLAGSFLSLAYYNSFVPEMTAGRGWMAVAIVILGGWNPWKVLLGSLIFGGADALRLRLKPLGFGVPEQFLMMIPYLLVIIALFLIARKKRAPAALAVPYSRAG
jgi:simple sugar transport system permease protein